MHISVAQIRDIFGQLLEKEQFVKDKSGVKLLEIPGASFIATEDHIFGAPNQEYIKKELTWYQSQSLNVNDIPNTPKIWKEVADRNGRINSNYGWAVFSGENGFQYNNVVSKLLQDPNTRQAIAIYTRPSMHVDAVENGRRDFMCTNTVQYLIRDGRAIAIVNMRSNDAWAGYRNDVVWQSVVLNQLVKDYNQNKQKKEDMIEVGSILWQVGSLHLYEPQFYLVDHYLQTEKKESTILKKDYVEKYPGSPYLKKEEDAE